MQIGDAKAHWGNAETSENININWASESTTTNFFVALGLGKVLDGESSKDQKPGTSTGNINLLEIGCEENYQWIF